MVLNSLNYLTKDINQWSFKVEKNSKIVNGYRLYRQNSTSETEAYRNGTDYHSIIVEKINGKFKITKII